MSVETVGKEGTTIETAFVPNGRFGLKMLGGTATEATVEHDPTIQEGGES